MIIFLNKLGKHLNIILSILRSKSADFKQSSDERLLSQGQWLASSRGCAVEMLRHSDSQLHEFEGQNITDENLNIKFNFINTSQTENM